MRTRIDEDHVSVPDNIEVTRRPDIRWGQLLDVRIPGVVRASITEAQACLLVVNLVRAIAPNGKIGKCENCLTELTEWLTGGGA